jgi:hypothetical protein
MAVIGGLENFAAAAIGAIIIQFLLEFLRESFCDWWCRSGYDSLETSIFLEQFL